MTALTRALDATNKRLLPTTSTPLEKNLVACASFDNFMDTAAKAVPSLKYVDIPDDAVMWLLLEYGLTGFLPYFNDPRRLLAEGIGLSKIRGTVAAIKKVADWVGYPGAQVYENPNPGPQFPCFEVNIGEAPDTSMRLCALVEVVNMVKPLRSRLRRVTGGDYDVRQLRLDNGPSWGQFLSGNSGVVLDRNGFLCGKPTQLWVSFGKTYPCEFLTVFGENDLSSTSWLEREQDINCFRQGQVWPTLDRDYKKSFNDPFMRFMPCTDEDVYVPTFNFREDTTYSIRTILDENRPGFNLPKPDTTIWMATEYAPCDLVYEETSGTEWTWQTLDEGFQFNSPFHSICEWMQEQDITSGTFVATN